MARQKPEDIAGYRRKHKRIPTSVALDADQAELQAKQRAIGKMGPTAVPGQAGGAAKTNPNRKPLSSYGQFGSQNAIGMGMGGPNMGGLGGSGGSGQLGAPNTPGNLGQSLGRIGGGQPAAPFNIAQLDGVTIETQGMTPAPGEEVQEEPKDHEELYNRVKEIFNEQLDPVAREERITRQRAAQEAAIRASMGSGETSMSGAAALLEGEAGRMAESQARTMELEREMGIAGLGLELAGYDLDKERYDMNEKRGLAMSALFAAEYVDADSAEELMNLLNIPEAAWDADHMAELDGFLKENREPDEEEEETTVTEETTVEDDGLSYEEYTSITGFDDFVEGTNGPLEYPPRWSDVAQLMADVGYTPSSGDWYYEGAWGRDPGLMVDRDNWDPDTPGVSHDGTIEYESKTYDKYVLEKNGLKLVFYALREE